MYLVGRETIRDRIFRIRTNDSVASMPLDRTSHMVDMILIESVDNSQIRATANWLAHSLNMVTKRAARNTRNGRCSRAFSCGFDGAVRCRSMIFGILLT